MKYQLIMAVTAVALTWNMVPAFAQGPPSGAELVAQMDKDGDKKISKQEWEASGNGYPFPEEADTNKDGKVDAAEMDAFFAQFNGGGAPPPPANASPATPPARTP